MGPPYDYAFLGTLIAIPIVWCVLWVASLALQDLTRPRIPNPAVSPFEFEERLARTATLCATVPPLLPYLLMTGEGRWPWVVLALVTAWWFPSATPTLQEWTLWVLTVVWLWFGATQAWWAVVLLIRKSEASDPTAGDGPAAGAP